MSVSNDSPISSPSMKVQGASEQSSSLGAHEVHSTPSDPGLNPQLSLTEDQQALKDKFGLPERVCANFDVESQTEVQNFTKDLKDGKFSPNIFKKFVLWLSSKLGGSDYESAVQQFRIETAATKNQDLFKNEEFQESLATAIKSCDGSELPQSLSVVYDLLSADPGARRDFFINKLLIPCLNEAHEEILKSKAEIDIKNFIEKYKGHSTINEFCRSNEMMCSGVENKQIKSIGEQIKARVIFLATNAMYCAITAGTENGKRQYLQYFQYLQEEKNVPEISKCVLDWSVQFETFDAMKGDFTNILQCFGTEQGEQIENFKTLVDGLRNIANEVQTESKTQNMDEPGKSFVQKGSEFLLKKPELMWSALNMLKTNASFSQFVFRLFINCPEESFEGVSNLFNSAALQAMGKAVRENETESLSDEQVQLLCEGANLEELLGSQTSVEKNRETIHMVLKFIQDRALASTDPKISFEDIMPADINKQTYRRLVDFVEKGQYDESLKVFIRNGRPPQGTSPNP